MSPGPYVFRILGQLCHLMGSLLPPPGETPKFSQIYLHGPDEAQIDHRMSLFSHGCLDANVVAALQAMMRRFNPYYEIWKIAHTRIMESETVLSIKVKTIQAPASHDHRRYNHPTAQEIAVIIPGSGTDEIPPQSRDIIIERRYSNELMRISELHSSYLPLRYPLLFPYGEQGWHVDLFAVGVYILLSFSLIALFSDPCRGNLGRRVTQMQFYSFHLQHRQNHFNTVLRSGRLFQEFLVDAYVQIEEGRIRWIRNHQGTFRIELYQGLADAAASGTDLNDVGSPAILPSSFIGGPRHMSQLYHDAMAIVRSCGKPDLFITMTCNPAWPEISHAIYRHQRPQDRPDIVARVFRLKLKALMRDIVVNKVFGRVSAHIHVIEFQKRGLPHAHILIVLHPQDKPHTNDAIDTIVCAEIPDPTLFPELHETVVNFMLHGPCGALNRNAQCMKKSNGETCDRKYPRSFYDSTTVAQDGYPLYRRRNDGLQVEKHGFLFDNRHIVPYNPYLSQKYNCHINVEIATTITSVKYLHKYIHKGHDRACVSLQVQDGEPAPQRTLDETKEYVDSRYVSASEAAWRIFSFSLHQHYPCVTRLQLHLPNMQTVRYLPDATSHELLEQPHIRRTTLTAFFELCAQYPQDTSTLLYPDCAKSYTWHKQTATWRKRQGRLNSIGRVYFASPTSGERYYLRLLLYNVHGPTSYEHLRTHNGVVYDSFQAACRSRGLIETDDEWDYCLQEAASFQTGSQLRQLFITILLMNDPSDPLSLFERYFHFLSDDCRHLLQRYFFIDCPTDEEIRSLVLQKLADVLEKSAKCLQDFKLPLPTIMFDNTHGIPRIIAQELDYDRDLLLRRWDEGYQMANADQRHILDTIVEAIDSSTGGLFFIDGPGGTGKTFVENLLLAYVRCHGQIALAVASSGIAALLLDGGRTSHSRFKIPIDIHSESQCAIPAQSQLAELLRMTKLIVWDEAPAQHRYCAQAVDRTLKDILKNTHPFGNITVVYGGMTCLSRFRSNC
jgi:hypothetical protein